MAWVSGWDGLLAFATMVVATAWAIVRPRAQGALDAALGIAVWSAAATVASAFALSLFHALTAPALLALSVATCGSAWLAHTRRARFATTAGEPPAPEAAPAAGPRRELGRPAGVRERVLTASVALPIAAFTVLSLQTAARAPESGHDNLAYHLPRLGYWIQQRAVAPFVAGNMRAGSLAPNGEVLALVPALFLRHDRACALVQLLAAVLTSAAVARTARSLGATPLASGVAALCWFAIPSVLDQALWSLNDLVAAFFVAASASFLARRDGSAYGPVTALASAVLATFTKTHVAAFTVPLALGALWRVARDHPRARAPVALLALPGALLLGGVFHLQNVWTWGTPSGLASNRWLVVHPSLASFSKNVAFAARPLTRLVTDEAGLVLRSWLAASEPGLGLFWLATALVSAAALVRALWTGARALRAWLALAALATGGGALVCVVLRHQPSQVRYLLPAAALFTATFAWAFDRLARPDAVRAAAAVLAGLGAGLVAWHWVVFERDLRTHPRYRDLQPLAAAVSRLAPQARIGVVGSAFFPESLFFEGGYRRRVLPLSYEPPRTPDALARLRLDALWVETEAGCGAVVFRRSFQPPPPAPERNRRASLDYDEDFTRAYETSVVWVDHRPTLLAAAASASWTVVLRHPRGVWLVRSPGPPIEVASVCP
jgi:hypothetical protein